MRVTAVFFARLRREAGADTLPLHLPEGATVRGAAAHLEEQLKIRLSGCMVAVNETYATPDHALQDGDEVAFLPPVAGGTEDWCQAEVTPDPLLLDTAARFLVRPECGAQAYFVGTVRSPNAGKRVESITYEGFEPMAVKIMRGAADRAVERFGPLRVFVQHRVGRLVPGEASILIGVASAHRRAALEACDVLIEELKRTVPVWKDELDEDGQHWVDGQTPHPTL